MDEKEKCPVCGNEKYAQIWINQGSFIAGRKGSIDIVCCNNCGVLRVTKDSLEFRKLKSE